VSTRNALRTDITRQTGRCDVARAEFARMPSLNLAAQPWRHAYEGRVHPGLDVDV
jgi:hypothetical protein